MNSIKHIVLALVLATTGAGVAQAAKSKTKAAALPACCKTMKNGAVQACCKNMKAAGKNGKSKGKTATMSCCPRAH